MVGIDAKNKNILNTKYICFACSLILKDPIQLLNCGHRICQSCVDEQHETTIKCSPCLMELSRNQIMIDRGFKIDMKSLPIECSFCQWTGILNNYQDHLENLHPNPKCDHCNTQFNSINKLNEHKVSHYQKMAIHCLLKDFGCDEQISHCDISNHYSSEQHQNSLLKIIHQINFQMDINDPQSTTVGAIYPAIADFKELHETIRNLLGETQTWDKNGVHLNNELFQFQMNFPTVTKDFLEVKPAVQESSCPSDGLTTHQNILEQTVAALKEKLADLQCHSYDGTLVWKITNFKEKMADAQSERQTSIYSPPFYSSPTGYKMRARLYLNGDGNARRTHMSLFFVLMRSFNDPILKFPFNYKVTFCMYDQTPAQRHIIDSFRPDIRSNSFQRPRSDMNIASGIPKFAPLTMIRLEHNPYVRDDTMFIKVMVDFGDMPKTLLSYALHYPEIPTHVLQDINRRGRERWAQ